MCYSESLQMLPHTASKRRCFHFRSDEAEIYLKGSVGEDQVIADKNQTPIQ